jgi:hypothetical protein
LDADRAAVDGERDDARVDDAGRDDAARDDARVDDASAATDADDESLTDRIKATFHRNT